jgi:hypothetical protein
MKNKIFDKIGKGLGLASALGFCLFLAPDKASALDVTADIITPMGTVTTGADDTVTDLVPVGIGMFAFGAIATGAKRIIYSA